MTDKLYPSSKPTANGVDSTAHAPAHAHADAAPNSNKSHLYNYNPDRHPYRPMQSLYDRRRRRPRRNLCCCCCFWLILTLLGLALLASIFSAGIFVLYRPQIPQFFITTLRVAKMNLTTSPDSNSHLTSLFNLTLVAKNPNNRLIFFYDPFTIISFSDSVQLGKGSLPAFTSDMNNETSFRAILSSSRDLDIEGSDSLKSGLKKNGFPIEIRMDTRVRVKVKMDKLKSNKLGIRVTCEGIQGTVRGGKSPSVSVASHSKCKVDLRVKIWKFDYS